MEPVTHLLTGAVMARAGLNRKAAYATSAMLLAAELPDIDIVWNYISGPVAGLEHHRGITHTFLAAPFEAAAVTGCFWLLHRFRKRSKITAPPHWGWLIGGCWLAVLSHLLLDWTNNYGIRPFFPFDGHWYAGSFVFIFEPVMFVLLLLALLLPALFGLIGSEVGSRRQEFRGRGWALTAIAGCLALYAWRYTEREKAIEIAKADGPASRVFASPYPIDPFQWSVVSETPEAYRLRLVDTRRGLVLPGSPADTLAKAPTTMASLVAKRTYLGRIYLDWSMFPVLTETTGGDDPSRPLQRITFADARFLYDVWGQSGRRNPPLSGSVLLDMSAPAGQRVEETRLNGAEQK